MQEEFPKVHKVPCEEDDIIEHVEIVRDAVPLLPLDVQQASKLTWEVDSLKAGTVVQGDFYRHGLTRRSHAPKHDDGWQALPSPIGFGEIHDGQREWTTVVPLERRHSVDAVG